MMNRCASLFLGVAFLLCAPASEAVERVSVCFNYGCLSQAEVEYSDGQLDEIRRLLAQPTSAAEEREVIATVVGRLLGWAGQQSPIGADRGGNYADDAVYGRMDCIDHSTTTTRLLLLLEKRGWLRFHRVLEPAQRLRFVLFQHLSAQIEELKPSVESQTQEKFVVDSWFFDNGQPAVVMPLEAWMAGGGPSVGE